MIAEIFFKSLKKNKLKTKKPKISTMSFQRNQTTTTTTTAANTKGPTSTGKEIMITSPEKPFIQEGVNFLVRK